MILALVCPCCGTELTRKRAEFAYSLPVVRCGCGYACVRRRHPMARAWRRGLCVARAWGVLVVQSLLAGLFTLASAGFIAGMQRELRDLGVPPWRLHRAVLGHGGRVFDQWFWRDEGYLFFLLVPLFVVVVGVWLRSSIGRWRWPIPALGWAALVGMVLWSEWLMYPFRAFAMVGPYTGPTARDTGEQAFLLAAALIIVLCAAPIGPGLESLFRYSRRQRFINRLRKRRAARKGQ